MLTPR